MCVKRNMFAMYGFSYMTFVTMRELQGKKEFAGWPIFYYTFSKRRQVIR